MIIYFDGGLRKGLIAIVNGDSDNVIIEKRKYNNDEYYEWDALEMALDYAKDTLEDIELVGDSNQVIRWIQEDEPNYGTSIIRQKCLEKLTKIRASGVRVIGTWVKRNENLAGRVLEYHTRRSSKPARFKAKWYSCSRCVFKSLNEREKQEHFWNEHITI